MLRGSLVAIVTPMRSGTAPDTPLDREALERLIEFHLEQGGDGIVAVGTTGESATLTPDEHCRMLEWIVDLVGGRAPVIAGTGANSTLEALELTRYAKEAGADACLLVTPYYNKPTQEGLYRHFKHIAEQVAIPQILYNVPSRTACDMLPPTVMRLSKIPNIIGVKEASGETARVEELKAGCRPDFLLLSGDDETACEFMLRGGHGVISVTANIAPAAMRRMCAHAVAGERREAENIDAELAGLHKELFVEANPIPVKWGVNRLGLIADGIRLPLTWLSDPFQPRVEAAMKQARVLK